MYIVLNFIILQDIFFYLKVVYTIIGELISTVQYLHLVLLTLTVIQFSFMQFLYNQEYSEPFDFILHSKYMNTNNRTNNLCYCYI